MNAALQQACPQHHSEQRVEAQIAATRARFSKKSPTSGMSAAPKENEQRQRIGVEHSDDRDGADVIEDRHGGEEHTQRNRHVAAGGMRSTASENAMSVAQERPSREQRVRHRD